MASERSGPHGVGGDPAGPSAREAHDPVHSAKEADAIRTLRSSSPRGVLGRPLASYRSLADRSRAVREPRAGLAEFGLALPDGVEVRVHDSTAGKRSRVVPPRPAGTEGWSRERLAGPVSRNAMIGVAQPRYPA
jgi:nitrile hydratase